MTPWHHDNDTITMTSWYHDMMAWWRNESKGSGWVRSKYCTNEKVLFHPFAATTWLCVIFMRWQSLDTSPPHIILDLAKPAPPWPGKQHFRANHLLRRKETLIWLFLRPSTSQHSCIVGFQETLGGRRKKSNLQRTNGTVKTFSSKGQLWPFLTASIFHICRQYPTKSIQIVYLSGISGTQQR